MATIISAFPPSPAVERTGLSGSAPGFKAYWRRVLATAFDPNRPELHYMRGPGPAWRLLRPVSRRRPLARPHGARNHGDCRRRRMLAVILARMDVSK